MMHDDIIKFFKMAMTFVFALALCAIVGMLCSCSRKATNIAENYEHTASLDSVHLSTNLTNKITDTTEWWNMDITTITYSEPDSTGKQHVTGKQTILSSGGRVIHDTTNVYIHDTIRVHARDSIIYKYKEKTAKTSNHSYIYIITFIISIGIIILLYLHNRKKNFFML